MKSRVVACAVEVEVFYDPYARGH